MAISAELERLLSRWLPRQGWYPRFESEFGADSDITPLGAVTVFSEDGEDIRGSWTTQGLVVLLSAGREGTLRRILVPLTLRTKEALEQRPSLVGEVQDLALGHAFVYDGATDPLFSVRMAEFILRGGDADGQLDATALGAGGPVEPAPAAALPAVEPVPGESTSSVIVDLDGGPYLLKYFRTYTPGENAAVSVPAALSELGSDAIPPVHGWLQGRWFDDDDLRPYDTHLALLTRYLPDSREAWREAVDSVVEVSDAEPGTYNYEARELGGRIGELHTDLAHEFGTVESLGDPTTAQVAAWRRRVDWALARAPLALGPLAGQLREYSRGLAELSAIGSLQRIHGDLTLNHVISSEAAGFRVTNFASEPVHTSRRASGSATPHSASSPAQDLVSLVRSFDYAAGYARLQRLDALGADAGSATGVGGLGSDLEEVVSSREFRWAAQAGNSLLGGYSRATTSPVDYQDPVFRAYVVDRLLTEVVTELRNRPAWLVIPLVTLTLLLDGRYDDLDGRTDGADHGDDGADFPSDDAEFPGGEAGVDDAGDGPDFPGEEGESPYVEDDDHSSEGLPPSFDGDVTEDGVTEDDASHANDTTDDEQERDRDG